MMIHGKGDPLPQRNQENIKLVQILIKDHRVTTDGVANEVGITYGSAFAILSEDLGLIKLSASRVPIALQEDQLNRGADLSLAIFLKMTQMKTNILALRHWRSICLTQETKFNQKVAPEG